MITRMVSQYMSTLDQGLDDFDELYTDCGFTGDNGSWHDVIEDKFSSGPTSVGGYGCARSGVGWSIEFVKFKGETFQDYELGEPVTPRPRIIHGSDRYSF